jgi:hypothetical protein
MEIWRQKKVTVSCVSASYLLECYVIPALKRGG